MLEKSKHGLIGCNFGEKVNLTRLYLQEIKIRVQYIVEKYFL